MVNGQSSSGGQERFYSGIQSQVYHFGNQKDSIIFEHVFPDTLGLTSSKVACRYSDLEIINSIDLNKDGKKEVVFKRECFCFTEPKSKPEERLKIVLVGGVNYSYGKYEVWDLNAKEMIFEFNDEFSRIETTSTSCVNIDAYEFYVKVKKDGTFITSNLRNGNTRKRLKIEMVKYKFVKGKYRKQ